MNGLGGLLTLAAAPSLQCTCLCIGALLLARWVWTARLGRRRRPARDAVHCERVDARAGGRSAGCMERWFQSLPIGHEACFVQSLTLALDSPSTSAPTRAELASALTLVAQRHPALLLDPVWNSLQLRTAALENVGPGGEVAFPHPALLGAVEVREEACGSRERAGHAVIQELLDSAPQECRFSSSPPSSSAASSPSSSSAAPWSPLRLICLAPANSGEFTLILRTSHAVSDGIGGLLILRHVLEALHSVRTRADTSSSLTKASSFLPLAHYPAMDDFIDLRPEVGNVVLFVLGELVGSLWHREREKKWWRGHTSAADPRPERKAAQVHSGVSCDDSEPVDRTGFVVSTLSASELTSLARSARAQGVSVHAALTTAACWAAAIVAKGTQPTQGMHEGEVLLKVATPFSRRKEMARAAAKSASEPESGVSATLNFSPHRMVGNYFCAHDSFLSFSATASSSRSFYSSAREYTADLRRGMRVAPQTFGLIDWIDVGAHIAQENEQWINGRTSSVEVSNLGLIDAAVESAPFGGDFAEKSGGLRILQCTFAQPAINCAPLFVNSALSCEAGGLTNLTSYSRRLVSDADAQLYGRGLAIVLQRLTQGDDLTLAQIQQK